jgi:uroporphyrinogen III methyltransferase/synthase
MSIVFCKSKRYYKHLFGYLREILYNVKKCYLLRLEVYMVAHGEHSLDGKRILVPPARPEANPLLNMLQRRGAEAIEFPGLIAAPPLSYGHMDEAIRHLNKFDWIIFSGRDCVINFFERFNALVNDRAELQGRKIIAIGHGAVLALKTKGIEINYIPRIHTARGVIDALQEISGSWFLLLRVEDASRSLPEKLRELGAKVSEVDGYRMIVDTSTDMTEKVLGGKFDAVALTNPTAVRYLLKGINQMGLNLLESLKGTTIAVVGPATAETARRSGLTPAIVSQGHIANLRDSLIEFFKD